MTTRGGTILLLAGLALANAAGAEPSAEVARVRVEDAVAQGPNIEERLAQIRRRIQAALEYPRLARWHDEAGETLVRFEIARGGAAREVRVFRSSGMPSLDRAALRAVEAAAPLPWVYGVLEVPVRFELDARR